MSTWEISGNRLLIDQIVDVIEQAESKSISFHDFMNMCLYEDRFGYYMNTNTKIGKEGDFYTSSSIGPFMGQMLATRFAQYIVDQGSEETFTITEWGSGAGKLALQILDELQAIYPEIYQKINYEMIEVSPYHQELQRELLITHIHKISFVDARSWWDKPPLQHAIVFSNELLDAFPIHLLQKHNGHYQEVYIAYDQPSDQFIEVLQPIQVDGELADYLDQYQVSGVEGNRIEINLEADLWLRRVGLKLQTGLLVTIDYGDIASEIYSEHRHLGTLMCYYQHQAHDNPYIHIGFQDVTSHINFSSCMHVGQEIGFTNQVYQTQRQFLIDQGILSKLQNHTMSDPFHPIAKSNRAIRQLLIGDTMSELFKVLIQIKEGD